MKNDELNRQQQGTPKIIEQNGEYDEEQERIEYKSVLNELKTDFCLQTASKNKNSYYTIAVER